MTNVEYIAFSSNDPIGYNDENIIFSAYSWDGFVDKCRNYVRVQCNCGPRALELFCTRDIIDLLETRFNVFVNYREITKQ